MAAARNVGNPFQDREVEQGPQVSENQFKRVMSYIESGKAEGATVYHGGERKGDTGYFIEPTIFTGMHYIYIYLKKRLTLSIIYIPILNFYGLLLYLLTNEYHF